MMRKERIVFTALMAVLALVVPVSAQAVAPTGNPGAPAGEVEVYGGSHKTPEAITPIPPTATPATGKCWAGEWKVSNNGKITLPKVKNAKWEGHGASKTITDLAPGTYTYTLKATNGAKIKDTNGFKNGKMSVTVKAQKASKDCSPPPAKVVEGKWSAWNIDCAADKATKTRTITTTGYVWSSKHGKWVEGDSQTKTQTETRKLTKDEKRECSPQPDPVIEYGKWSKWTVDCEAGHAVKAQTVTTINYVWNAKHKKWELDRKNAETTTEYKKRALEDHEKRECTPKPDPKVKHGHWSNWTVDCDAGHAVKTRDVTTTDYVWKHGKWVLDHKNTETSTERDTRGLKDHEKRECTPQPDPIVKYSHWSKWTVDCDAGHAVKTRTVTTTPYEWSSKYSKWIKGASETHTDTQHRALKDHEKRECTPKPDPKVKHGHWSKWVVDCDAGHAVKTRTVSTTDYRWDSKKSQWVLDHKNTETSTERDTRGLKDHEKRECTPKPDPIVKYSHWSKWTADCEAGHAFQTYKVKTVDHIWRNGHWVPDWKHATTEMETKTRDLTKKERSACKPDPIVKHGEWKEVDRDCDAQTLTEKRITKTVTFKWHHYLKKWVGHASYDAEYNTRDMSEDEVAQCPAPISDPPPETVEGEWETVAAFCDSGEIAETRTVTTFEFELVDGEWQEVSRSDATENRTREMTEDELGQCPAPIDEPPVEEPPAEEPPAQEPPAAEPPAEEPVLPVSNTVQVKTPARVVAQVPTAVTTAQLPRTGSSTGHAALFASVLITLGIGAVATSRVLRKQRR